MLSWVRVRERAWFGSVNIFVCDVADLPMTLSS